jgi:protein CpxP
MMKKALIALALIGVAGSAYAQTGNQMPSGASAPPAGTTTPGMATPPMPPSTTNTARPGALDSTNVTAAEAAARTKIQSAGYSDIKGLTRNTDGTWSGRAVKNSVEVGVVLDSSNNVTAQ